MCFWCEIQVTLLNEFNKIHRVHIIVNSNRRDVSDISKTVSLIRHLKGIIESERFFPPKRVQMSIRLIFVVL